MSKTIAKRVALFYWFGVAGVYLAAMAIRDDFGIAFIPFMLLSLPWSLLTYSLTNEIAARALASAIYAAVCFLLSGINAVALYLILSRHDRRLHRKEATSKNTI